MDFESIADAISPPRRARARIVALGGACCSSLALLATAACRSDAHAVSPTRQAAQVRIDFQTPERAPLAARVEIDRATTPIDLARKLAPVEQDWLCCSPKDVWSIGGLSPDPARGGAWMWSLNGELGREAPSAYRVQDGDLIEWTYQMASPAQLQARLARNGPRRVISLLPAATDMLNALGAGDLLVGVSHLCTGSSGGPPPAQARVVCSTNIDSDRWSMGEIDRAVREAGKSGRALYDLDERLIRELEPQLVISQGLCPVCAPTPEDARALHGANCPELLVLSPHGLADVAENMRQVGAAIGLANEGKILARAFERRLQAIDRLPPLAVRPRVAVLEWFDPLWASGEWIAEQVERAGGIPVLARPCDPSQPIEWRTLVEANPDVILLGACSMDIARTLRETASLSERPEWAELAAVRGDRVFVLDGRAHFSTPGPGLAEGAEIVAELLRQMDTLADSPGRCVRLRGTSGADGRRLTSSGAAR